MTWVTFDEALLLNDMPTDFAVEYAAWLVANPAKVDRLEEIASRTRAEVRDNISSNPKNQLSDTEEEIPESTIQAAETIAYHTLAMEMGLEMTPEANQTMTQARMQLRTITYDHFVTTTEDGEVSPVYNATPTMTARSLPS